MPSPQFQDRTRWVRCNECDGRSFSDPTQPYHYPGCSKYRTWRFGRTRSKPMPMPFEDRSRYDDSVLEDFWREYAGGEDW